MRTVVISDLHLGAGRRVWLCRPEVAETLGEAVEGADRLVLLGDVLELRHAPARTALDAADEVLPPLVDRLAPEAEIIVVPGNHDHALGMSWALRRSASPEHPPLGLEETVDWRPEEPLAVLAEMLGRSGGRVRAAYPGVWLRDDVYAHHGHYLDRHTTVPLIERLGAAAMGRVTRTPIKEIATVDDYENVLAPIYNWMYPIAQGSGEEVEEEEGPSARLWRGLQSASGPRRWALNTGAGALVGVLNRAGLGPLSAQALTDGLDGAELPAMNAMLTALGVRARFVIFGHTHRAGPLPGEVTTRWRTGAGIRLINSGSWVHDPLFIGLDERTSPFRPGWAVEIVDDEEPRLINLLDEAD